MATVHKFPEGVSNEKSEFLLAEPSDSASRLAFISIHSTNCITPQFRHKKSPLQQSSLEQRLLALTPHHEESITMLQHPPSPVSLLQPYITTTKVDLPHS